MHGFDLLAFFYSTLLITGVAGLQTARIQVARSKSRQHWLSLQGANFVELRAMEFLGLTPAQAERTLGKLRGKRGELASIARYFDWVCEVDARTPERVETTVRVLSRSGGVIVEAGKIWVRWRIEERRAGVLTIIPEWAEDSAMAGIGAGFRDAILAQVFDRANDLLRDFADLNKSHLLTSSGRQLATSLPGPTAPQVVDSGPTDWSAAPSVSSFAELPKPKTVDFLSVSARHQGSVTLPSRVFDGVGIKQTSEMLIEMCSKGGLLREPITGTEFLLWEGSCVSMAPDKVEASISFSKDYVVNAQSAELSDQLVILWELKDLQNGTATRVSCQWAGEFQRTAGDIIRYLTERLDREMRQAGARPYLANQAPQQRSKFVRSAPKSGFDWFRDLPENSSRTSTKAFWPSLQDYNEAIQYPETCFSDAELKSGEIELGPLGLPKVATGAFASVYKVSCGERNYAVRCFNTAMKDQEERYKRTSRFICADDLIYTVDLHYIEKGILVKGQWFPVLKMEWVQGVSIYDYIDRNHKNQESMIALRARFCKMLDELKSAGIAHSDLQHGNILVRNDELVLVDYDGMFVPELSGFLSNERGHPNYQHPSREGMHFGPYLDNFSAWVIDTALLTLIHDISFWKRFSGDLESLMFKRHDFEFPHKSALLESLCNHSNGLLSDRGHYIQSLLRASVDRIPYFVPDSLPGILSEEFKISEPAIAKPSVGRLPDWMN